MKRRKTIQTKAIKYSLACAIQDVSRVCAHIASALSLWKVRESESEAILALSDAGILPKEFAEKIKGMPAFRNRIIHDYLPNEFDAIRLFETLQNLDDFRTFSKIHSRHGSKAIEKEMSLFHPSMPIFYFPLVV